MNMSNLDSTSRHISSIFFASLLRISRRIFALPDLTALCFGGGDRGDTRSGSIFFLSNIQEVRGFRAFFTTSPYFSFTGIRKPARYTNSNSSRLISALSYIRIKVDFSYRKYDKTDQMELIQLHTQLVSLACHEAHQAKDLCISILLKVIA